MLDDWLSDPGAVFQAAEVDGAVAGVQRIRPLGEGIAWYEGLRVAREQRRTGVATAMLRGAIEGARAAGFRELRLGTGNPRARPLFERAGMDLVNSTRHWTALRVEGGDPPRIPGSEVAAALMATVSADPGAGLFAGVAADGGGARDVTVEQLRESARRGEVRMLTERAFALVKEAWSGDLRCTFFAGRGGRLRDLMTALRFEADQVGLGHVSVRVPHGHPGESDLEAVGYALDPDGFEFHVYRLKL